MSSEASASTDSPPKKRSGWATFGLVLLVLVVVGGLIALIVWLTSYGGSNSSSSTGLPTPGSWVNKNFKWQVVPPVSSNFIKTTGPPPPFSPLIGADDINASWTLITPNAAVLLLNPGSFTIQNVPNNVNLSCDAIGSLSMVTTGGVNESWLIEVSGTAGYIFRSFSNRYLVAAGNVLQASATTADAATIFHFTQIVF